MFKEMAMIFKIEIVWVQSTAHVPFSKKKAFLGKTKANPYLSLLSIFGSRALLFWDK